MDSKFGRYLLFVVSVVAIAIAVDHFQGRWINNQLTHWITSTLSYFDQKYNEYSSKLDDLSNEPKQAELKRTNFSSETIKTAPQYPQPSQQGFISKSSYEHEVHSHSCSRAALTEKQIADRKRKQEESLIFSWIDEDGMTHFSDTLFGNEQNTKVLDLYGIELNPFEMTINTKRTLPKFFERDTSVGVKKIYQILNGYMNEDLIKPVQLNLTFAHSKREYDALQKVKAPTATSSQGFYSGKHNLAAVWYKNDLQARRTAIHEAVHVINSGLFGNTPRWLNEGLAEYFETIKVSGLAAKITPLNWQQNAAVQRMSLRTVIYGENNNWKGSSRHNMYVASHSFVYFLMSTPKGKKLIKQVFKSLAENRCQRHNLQSLFASYPTGFYGLENDWKNWMHKGKYRTQTF
ncbi:DUF1570 domain-containing protein [Shewanella sp. 202IG2-18]|uniref:peptidase MA family metallohydrolase n=1 Tax=Parashewanella hymeniacidonis TaxID=2807618 RepID=UPI001961ACEC|nr:DUF1570 domain-containing protein [Parashewanella hymeniacidonis]MBM7072409.1 DUF1570 domain-containing protein [Parashewanella hymeniacidonis]